MIADDMSNYDEEGKAVLELSSKVGAAELKCYYKRASGHAETFCFNFLHVEVQLQIQGNILVAKTNDKNFDIRCRWN